MSEPMKTISSMNHFLFHRFSSHKNLQPFVCSKRCRIQPVKPETSCTDGERSQEKRVEEVNTFMKKKADIV